MADDSSINTSASLLRRLHSSTDAEAWDRFVDLYTPLLYRWAGRLTLQDADVADLVQNVMLHLMYQLPNFHYQTGKRFRGWLWTVLRNKYRENLRKRVDCVFPEHLGEIQVSDDIEELAETEYRQVLTHRALELMRQDFQASTWQACWDTVVSGKSAEQVAQELGMSPGAVRAAKFRVLCRLRAEFQEFLE